MSLEQLKSCLESANLGKEQLSSNSQDTLRKLGEIMALICIHENQLNPQVALAEFLLLYSRQSRMLNKEISLLNHIQNSYRESYVLLSSVKHFKNQLLNSEKPEILDNITYELQPKKSKLTEQLESVPEPVIEGGLTHETLLELAGTANSLIKEVSELQSRSEIYSNLPLNTEQVEEKIREAEATLESLENDWNDKISVMFDD